MQQKKICLTKNELEEICFEYHQKAKKYGIITSDSYARGIFDLLARNPKESRFTKLSNFIDKKADSFFMVFLVGTIFLLMKIAIEAYFLSIK